MSSVAWLHTNARHDWLILRQATAALGLLLVLTRRYTISFKGKQALSSAARFLGPTGQLHMQLIAAMLLNKSCQLATQPQAHALTKCSTAVPQGCIACHAALLLLVIAIAIPAACSNTSLPLPFSIRIEAAQLFQAAQVLPNGLLQFHSTFQQVACHLLYLCDIWKS